MFAKVYLYFEGSLKTTGKESSKWSNDAAEDRQSNRVEHEGVHHEALSATHLLMVNNRLHYSTANVILEYLTVQYVMVVPLNKIAPHITKNRKQVIK